MGRIDPAPYCVECPWCKTKPVFEYVRNAGDKHDMLYCPNFESEDASTHCPVMPAVRQNHGERRDEMTDRWNAYYNMVPRSAEAALATEVERLREALVEIRHRASRFSHGDTLAENSVRGLADIAHAALAQQKEVGETKNFKESINE